MNVFVIQLEKNKFNTDSMVIFYMNVTIEIFKQNQVFNFLKDGKQQTKDEINKKYNYIEIDHLDKNLNVKVDNYFHLNWTEKNIINMDFKDEKLVDYLCGMCGKRIFLN